jgi:hypothetical protein
MNRVRIPAILFSFLLCLVLAFQVLPAGVPMVQAANTWYVDGGQGTDAPGYGTGPGSNAFKTITYAVTSAASADTIQVAAGTYTGKVTISNPLTLSGANAGISAGAVPGTRGSESVIQGGVQIQGNSVVIDGFKIDGPATSGQKDGIYIVGSTSGHTIANNVLAGHGTSSGDGWAMEFGYYTSAITVRNNEIVNWWSSYINPTNPGSNLLFEGNHFHDNSYGIGSDGLNDVNLQSNEFTNNAVEGWGTSTVGANVQAHNNVFVGNGMAIKHYGGGQTVDAINNWWGDNTGPFNATTNSGGKGDPVSDSVSFTPWTTRTVPEVWVDDNYGPTTPGWHVDHFAKVQDGINNVDPAGKVNVAAGTYVEQLNIARNLTIAGAGVGSAIIRSPDVLQTKFSSSTFGTTKTEKPVIYVHNTTSVIIQGLTVDGAGKGNGNYRMEGIAYYNAAGTVQNCEIKDLRETPMSGNQHGVGIYAYNDDGVARTLNVASNSISGYQKNGVAFLGQNLTVNVTGNTITGAGPTSLIAQNGIEFALGTSGTIGPNNTVSGNFWTGTYGGSNDPISDPNADGSTGICFYASGSVTIQGNTLNANQFGIWSVAATSLAMEANTVTGTPVSGVKITGIAVWDADLWTAGFGLTPVSTVASITNSNSILSNDYGLLIKDYNLSDAYQPTVAAQNNDIMSNSIYGAWANVAVNAEQNWWGSASGPYHSTNPTGTGNAVSDNVLFDPWTGVPTVGSVSPSQGNQGQTMTSVVIGGTYLTGASAVDFGAGITVNSFTVDSTTQITVNITISGSAATGARDVSVTTPGGTGVRTGGFMVNLGGPPPAPTLVSPANGAGIMGGSVTFQWTAVPGAVNYRLLVSTSSNFLDTTKYKRNITVGSGSITSYVDTGYTGQGTKYYWWVWAYGADGSYSPWAQVSANGRNFTNVPSIGAPTLVSPANGASVSGTSVTFQWTAVSGAVDYRLVVSASSNIMETTKYKRNVTMGSGAVTSYVDTGYTGQNTKFYWWVWAYAADGPYSPSTQVLVNSRNFTNVPSIGTPTLVSPANGAGITGVSVTFQWTAVSGAVDYRLLVSTSSNIMETTKYKRNVTMGSGSSTSYVDSGYPVDGTQYYWWVFAYAADGNFSLGSEVSANRRNFTSMPSVATPTLVSPANGASVVGASVTFQWSTLPDAVDYKLLVSTSANPLDTTKYKRNVNVGSGSITSYVDSGYPVDGTKYYWWVWAYAADGTLSTFPTVLANGRNFISISVEAPRLLSPANSASASGTSVTFQWSAVSGAVNYKLVVSTSSNVMDTTKYKCNLMVGSGDITTYMDTGYTGSGTKYYWWVWAYAADGSVSLWAQVSANGSSFTNTA